MSSSTNPVVMMIEQLYKARHDIAEAYDAGEVTITQDNELAIEPLLKMNLLSHTRSDSVRVVTDLKRLLNNALRTHGILSINSDLGNEVGAMEVELSHLQEHESANDIHQTERSLDEIRHRLYAIFDVLNNSAIQLQSRVDTGFARSNNIRTRHKENAYYLKELDKLVDSFNETRAAFESEAYQYNSQVKGYIHNIESKCLSVIDRIKQIQDVIRKNIFKQRELEDKAIKLRSLFNYFRDRPSFYPEKSELKADQHEAFLRPNEQTVLPYPDIDNNRQSVSLITIILDLQKRINVDRREVERENTVLDHTVQKQEPTPTPYSEVMARQLLRKINKDKQPCSALEYFMSENMSDEEEPLTEEYWLYYLLNFFQPGKRVKGHLVENYIRSFPITKSHPIFSGNHSLQDIVVYPASMSVDQLLDWLPEKPLHV